MQITCVAFKEICNNTQPIVRLAAKFEYFSSWLSKGKFQNKKMQMFRHWLNRVGRGSGKAESSHMKINIQKIQALLLNRGGGSGLAETCL